MKTVKEFLSEAETKEDVVYLFVGKNHPGLSVSPGKYKIVNIVKKSSKLFEVEFKAKGKSIYFDSDGSLPKTLKIKNGANMPVGIVMALGILERSIK